MIETNSSISLTSSDAGLAASSETADFAAAIGGPLREATRGDAKVLVLLSALALVAKSDQAASMLGWLSSPLGFRARTVPFLLSTLVGYFLAVFLLRTVSDILVWRISWRSHQKLKKTTLRLIAAFAGLRFAFDYCLPILFGFFALSR